MTFRSAVFFILVQGVGASSAPQLQCAVAEQLRSDCGYNGITEAACEQKGCCWKATADATNPNYYPWCFLSGGGGGDPAPAPKLNCVNSQIDIKSQSQIYANTETRANITTGDVTVKEFIARGTTSKIDVDKMNLYEWDESAVSLRAFGDSKPFSDMETLEKIIVNVAKKVIVQWYRVTNLTSGEVLLANCSAFTIDDMPEPELVSLAFKSMVVPELQKVATCSSNDGTYDHFDMNINFQSPTIAGLQTVTDVDVQGTQTILMDKDLLFHSAKGDLKVKATIETNGVKVPVFVDESTETTSSQAAPGGPEPADLDYSSFEFHDYITCIPIHIHHKDITTLFQPTRLSEITKKFNNNALFKNQFLAAIQAAMKTTEAKKLIV